MLPEGCVSPRDNACLFVDVAGARASGAGRGSSCSDDLRVAPDQLPFQPLGLPPSQPPPVQLPAFWMGSSLSEAGMDATGRASLPALPLLGVTDPGEDAFGAPLAQADGFGAMAAIGLYPPLHAVSKHPLEADMDELDGSGGSAQAASETAGSDASTGTPRTGAAALAAQASMTPATIAPAVVAAAGCSTVESAPAAASMGAAMHTVTSAPLPARAAKQLRRQQAVEAAPPPAPPTLPPRQARTTKNSKQALKHAADMAAAAAAASPRGKKRTAGRIAANPNGHCCTQCGTQSTPVWRAGPHGPKTLCNACGVRYMKVAKRK